MVIFVRLTYYFGIAAFGVVSCLELTFTLAFNVLNKLTPISPSHFCLNLNKHYLGVCLTLKILKTGVIMTSL